MPIAAGVNYVRCSADTSTGLTSIFTQGLLTGDLAYVRTPGQYWRFDSVSAVAVGAVVVLADIARSSAANPGRWIFQMAGGASGAGIKTETFLATNNQTVFPLAGMPVGGDAANVIVAINGVLYDPFLSTGAAASYSAAIVAGVFTVTWLNNPFALATATSPGGLGWEVTFRYN